MQPRCPLCTANTEPSRLGPASFGLRRCVGCGIVFLPVESMSEHAQDSQDAFFAEMYRGSWQQLLEVMNAHLVLRRIRKYKKDGRLLEIGIGNGNFLRTAQSAGYDCMGVEASEGLVGAFARRSSLPVFHGYLEEFAQRSPRERFDVIVMNHVLEHIPDPLTALKQLRELLREGGILHLAVPNVDAWEAKLHGWSAFEPYHLYYFNPETLAQIAGGAGFTVTRLATAERFSGWTNALVRTLLKKSYQDMSLSHGPKVRSLKQHFAKTGLEIARVAVGTATLPLRYVQSRAGRGEELIALLRTA